MKTMRATTAQTQGHGMRQRWIGFWWWIGMPLDLLDLHTGLPDHDRLVSFGVGLGFGYKVLTEPGYPPFAIAALAISAMFGVRMFRLFLARSNFQAKDVTISETVKVTQEIVKRRVGMDVEPSP
jgi:hypothetical protein